MVDPINNSSTTGSAGGLGAALGSNKSLGKDAFLKLLVAQLRHQDPLKPQDSSDFIAELAQFSSVEQTMGINDRLDMMALQNQGLANSQTVGLVGKSATVRGSMVTTDGSGLGVPLNFTLNGESAETTVTIRDQSGRVVRTLEVGAREAGLVRLTWDGRDNAGVVQPAGSYVVTVEAKNEAEAPVPVSQETTGLIRSVSFDKGYPVLHLDNGISVPVSDLLRVEAPSVP
jgi:flagellar basal-body rod modification protein FlgD